MGVVAADALAFIEDFPRRHGGAGVLVAESDVAMDEIADRLDPRPARRRRLEQLPRRFGQPIGLAIAAAEQVDQRLRRQSSIACCSAEGNDRVGQAAVAHHAVGGQRIAPAGATMRLHQLPKPSRYGVIGTEGSVVR